MIKVSIFSRLYHLSGSLGEWAQIKCSKTVLGTWKSHMDYFKKLQPGDKELMVQMMSEDYRNEDRKSPTSTINDTIRAFSKIKRRASAGIGPIFVDSKIPSHSWRHEDLPWRIQCQWAGRRRASWRRCSTSWGSTWVCCQWQRWTGKGRSRRRERPQKRILDLRWNWVH